MFYLLYCRNLFLKNALGIVGAAKLFRSDGIVGSSPTMTERRNGAKAEPRKARPEATEGSGRERPNGDKICQKQCTHWKKILPGKDAADL